jgi:hypothetical protein
MGEEIETLEKHKEFFANYKSTFLKNFIKICSELNPDVTSNDKVEVFIGNLYDRLFPLEINEKDDSDIDSEFYSIREKAINLKPALSENFFLMIKDFVNFFSPKETRIIHLKLLINKAGECISALDRVGYENNKEIRTKDIVVEKEREEKGEEEEAIIKGFELIEKERKEVKLINICEGLLLRYNSSISHRSKDKVIFNIHKFQAVVMEDTKQTFVKSEIFPKMIKANVGTVNLKELKATLTDFVYVDGSPEKRSYMRIQPKDPIDVLIQDEERIIRGQLVDISIAAIAVYVEKKRIFKRNANVRICLKLPKISQNTSTETNVKGRINIVYGEETNFDKLVIEIDNDLYSEPVISQYISYRQAEIVKAMKIRSEEFE